MPPKGETMEKKSVAHFILDAIANNKLSGNIKTGEIFNRYGNKINTISQRGYIIGTIHLNGKRKQIKAHQAVWLLSGQIIKEGFVLDHINGIKTDNRINNLRLVTNKENIKNRRSYDGENNPASILNRKDVDKIKNGWPQYTYKELANQYGVCQSSIGQIVRGESWKS